MFRSYTLKMILALVLSTGGLVNAQIRINPTSSGFTRENTKSDGGENGSFSYKTLPIARPSWNGNAAEGKKAYFNFDLKELKGAKIKKGHLYFTFSEIDKKGNDEGFTLLLKAYVEDTKQLPLEPDHGDFDFSGGYISHSFEEKNYNGGGDYPDKGSVLDYDIEEFLNTILSESKTKVLFELSIKEKVKDKFFKGRIASSLNYKKSSRPFIEIITE